MMGNVFSLLQFSIMRTLFRSSKTINPSRKATKKYLGK